MTHLCDAGGWLRPYNVGVRVFLLSLAAAIVAAFTVSFTARPAAAATEGSRSEASSLTLRLNRTLRRHYQLRQRWEMSQRRRVVKLALHQVGIPYAWGGTSRSGFDCSGLVRWVYSNLGVLLPHYTVSQFQHGSSVHRRALKPGDLVFFNGLRHVGLYIGHGEVVHAPHSGTRVSVAPLSSVGGFAGARRLIPAY